MDSVAATHVMIDEYSLSHSIEPDAEYSSIPD
jgi:hypothetical protein